MKNLTNQLPKACLFDFDGVVVDSFATHYAAWSQAFEQLFNTSIPPFPHKTHAGKAPILIAEYFCSQIGKSASAHELFTLKGQLIHSNTQPPTLLPGVHEISNFLTQQKIPYGIASNATIGFVSNSISQLDLNFDHFLGFENYKHPKPHPEPYLTLAEKLGIKETDFNQTWVFEDSLTGTKAALEAGMTAIGIATQHSKEELLAIGSTLAFANLKEALEYLEEV